VAEKKIVLRNCQVIDPRQIDSYLARDGFRALLKARDEMTPEQVIAEVKASGLRGRGGGGFLCGLKWELARKSKGNDKYIIANADEGEMGTFKDRYILENDPFTLIEALAIAGYAVGAGKGYIYLRAEYHHLLDLLTNTIKQAQHNGLLDFDIELREGAGAYVCGEETALMDSIEGKRGEIRYRPPYPPTIGLWQRPTVINNVETLMNIPPIILNGAGWFSQMGTTGSKGTKVFSVSGDVNRPGVYELVMGSPLRELVEKLAQAERVRMVQVGGAGGRILPYAMIDTSLTYETVLGAGAVIVLDESRDAVDIVYKSL
jgi:NADH:ubiquinone oxidoreductase subunit F (NADH-binding)